ncbi:hypothetical protein HIM_06376 [Hirsutella minnesotensis 3608]|uniref:L-ascorbate oxidase n=1 Tax=Hirsutella minnesotensis 3608 TaxID=1043627 RepID=A0A0F7ZNQ2_9HYPO|nr:hypothetical protein HIM_06376 [Hirsutella minnesotensis 3608]
MLWSAFRVLLVSATAGSSYRIQEHAETFSPDAILRVTTESHRVGSFDRYTTLVNGSMPGPAIRIPEEQVFWIRVYNDMPDANLTMHWHGLSLAAFPFSDGTPLSSQWPIPPHHFFDYEIKAAKGSAGTYFYHSHIGLQAHSAAGPLIVEDATSPPYQYHEDKTIFIQESWLQQDKKLIHDLESDHYKWVQNPDVFLFNGRGLRDFNNRKPGPFRRDGGTEDRLATFDVEPDKTYRLRFIAAQATSLTILAFEDHGSMDIIQADGDYTEPYAVGALQMGPGQRYDALLRTKTCEELHGLGKLDFHVQMENRAQPWIATGYAVLRYDGSKCRGLDNGKMRRLPLTSLPAEPPLELPLVQHGFLDYKLEPLRNNSRSNETFPRADEVTRRVVYNIQEFGRNYTFYVVNNITWAEDGTYPTAQGVPREPFLVSLYKNRTRFLPDYEAAVANGGLDPRTKTYPARVGEVVEIVMQHLSSDKINNDGTRMRSVVLMHPWHAHGAKFWDAGGGDGAWDPKVVEEKLEGTKPVRRDTTMLDNYRPYTDVPGVHSGWRVWRLRITQPGVWLVHCHTLPHMIQGLQTVWVHGDADQLLKVGRPDVDGYLTYGGDAYGNITHTPRVIHFNALDE